jgi:hypothetical protein
VATNDAEIKLTSAPCNENSMVIVIEAPIPSFDPIFVKSWACILEPPRKLEKFCTLCSPSPDYMLL